jgi:hypothetical protein
MAQRCVYTRCYSLPTSALPGIPAHEVCSGWGKWGVSRSRNAACVAFRALRDGCSSEQAPAVQKFEAPFLCFRDQVSSNMELYYPSFYLMVSSFLCCYCQLKIGIFRGEDIVSVTFGTLCQIVFRLFTRILALT